MAGITLTIEVDDKGTVKVKQFADESKKAFYEMQKGPKAAQGPLASLQESWVGLTAKVAAATAVVYGIGRAFASFVNEAAEAEQIENRLKFALETTGYTWQYAKQAVDQFASSIQEMTRFSDEQARQALTDMMMYTNDFAKAQMGAKLAMDMSIRTGQDLGSTSRLIGMAMSGNVEMLGRYIPSLKNVKDRLGENATATQIWEYALKELQRLFGGTAQADIDSYAGKLAQFKNAWSDFKEKIGNEILPPLKELLDTLKKITEEITKEPPYKEIPLAKFWGIEITRRVPLKGEELQEVLLQRQRVAAYQSQKLAAETKRDILPDLKKETEKLTFDPRTIVDQVRGAIAQINREYEALGIAALEANEKMIQAWDIPSADEILKEIDKWIAKEEELGQVAIARRELVEAGWEATAKAEADAIREGIENARLLHQAWLEEYTATSDLQALWNNLAQGISSSWSQHVNNIIRGSESLLDGLKNIFKGIGDAFVSEVAKMITQWLLFGSITGKGQKGGSSLTGSLWSGILGWLFHGGGIVGQSGSPKPVPAAAFIGAPRLHAGFMPEEYPAILKKGEGVFTPDQMKSLGGKIPIETGKKSGDTYVYFVNPIGFDQALMKNMGTILKGVAKDARMAGPMHSIMKGNG